MEEDNSTKIGKVLFNLVEEAKIRFKIDGYLLPPENIIIPNTLDGHLSLSFVSNINSEPTNWNIEVFDPSGYHMSGGKFRNNVFGDNLPKIMKLIEETHPQKNDVCLYLCFALINVINISGKKYNSQDNIEQGFANGQLYVDLIEEAQKFFGPSNYKLVDILDLENASNLDDDKYSKIELDDGKFLCISGGAYRNKFFSLKSLLQIFEPKIKKPIAEKFSIFLEKQKDMEQAHDCFNNVLRTLSRNIINAESDFLKSNSKSKVELSEKLIFCNSIKDRISNLLKMMTVNCDKLIIHKLKKLNNKKYIADQTEESEIQQLSDQTIKIYISLKENRRIVDSLLKSNYLHQLKGIGNELDSFSIDKNISLSLKEVSGLNNDDPSKTNLLIYKQDKTKEQDGKYKILSFFTNNKNIFNDIEEIKIVLPKNSVVNNENIQEYVNNLIKIISKKGFNNEIINTNNILIRRKNNDEYQKLGDFTNKIITKNIDNIRNHESTRIVNEY